MKTVDGFLHHTDPGLHHILTLETHIPPVDYFFAKTKSKADHALKETQEFPGDPVVRTWCFHCQGLGSIPSQGTKNPQALQQCQGKKKKRLNKHKLKSECLKKKKIIEGHTAQFENLLKS